MWEHFQNNLLSTTFSYINLSSFHLDLPMDGVL